MVLLSGSVIHEHPIWPDLKQHPSWHALAGTYSFVHNAFRNDLNGMIALAEKGMDIKARFAVWIEAYEMHTHIEDDIFIPALKARVGPGVLPESLTERVAHDSIDALVGKVSQAEVPAEQQRALEALRGTILPHLEEEERNVLPKLFENFTTAELWALDSFIINESLGYCSKDALVRITKWWFKSITWGEGWALAKNFARASQTPQLTDEEWSKLQSQIPALQGRPLSEVMGRDEKQPLKKEEPPGPVMQDFSMLLKFSVNITFMCAAFVLMKSTDVAIIGHIGSEYLVAVSMSDLWTSVIGVLLMGSVLQVFVGNSIGAGNLHMAGVWLTVSLVIMAVMAIFVMALWCCTEPILRASDVDEDIASNAGYYAIVTAFCLPFRTLHMQVSKFFEGQGIMSCMLPSMVAGSVVNLLLGLQFGLGIPISSWGFGFHAVPLGTIGGEMAQVLVVVGWFCGVKKLHQKCWPGWSISHVTRARVIEFLKLYMPEVASLASDFIRMSVVGVLAAVIGDSQLAVFQISYRFLWMGLIIVMAIGIAQGIMISMFLGGGSIRRAQRITKIGLAFNCTFLILLSLVLFFFARSLGKIFTSDPVLLDLFEEQRLPISLLLITMNLSTAIERILSALGRARAVFWSGVVGSWVGQVPFVLVLTRIDPHLRMVYWGIVAGYGLLVVLQLLILASTDWEACVRAALKRAETGSESKECQKEGDEGKEEGKDQDQEEGKD